MPGPVRAGNDHKIDKDAGFTVASDHRIHAVLDIGALLPNQLQNQGLLATAESPIALPVRAIAPDPMSLTAIPVYPSPISTVRFFAAVISGF